MPIKQCLENVYLGYHTYVVITVCSILIQKNIDQNDKNETDFVDFYYPCMLLQYHIILAAPREYHGIYIHIGEESYFKVALKNRLADT